VLEHQNHEVNHALIPFCFASNATIQTRKPSSSATLRILSQRCHHHIHAYCRNNRLCGNGDLNLNTGLDVDDDLLDDLSGGVEVNESLVDSHLVHVPCL